MASRLSVRTLTHAGRAVSNLPRVTCLSTPTRTSQFSSMSSVRVSQYARLQSIPNQRTFASSARMVSGLTVEFGELCAGAWGAFLNYADSPSTVQAANTRIETDAFGEIEVRVAVDNASLNN